MIASVIGSYIDSLKEREFDVPFMALLRTLGFRKIHFLHGSFEFGKDFIGRKSRGGSEFQYCFQTKAGDLSLSDWGICRTQLDLLRTNSLAHPSFDHKLPRTAVLVTTGRLVGGAAIAAQDYNSFLKERKEAELEVWDRETLIDLIALHPESIVPPSIEGELLALLGEIDQGKCDETKIESVSRRWFGSSEDSCKFAIIASIVANSLRRSNRVDLACYAALCLIRSVWASNHGTATPNSTSLFMSDAGRKLFRFYSSELLTEVRSIGTAPDKMVWANPSAAVNVTYPIRCVRITEILGLLGLLDIEEKTIDHKIETLLVDFVHQNPGTMHPISDRWAVSLIPPILLLAITGHVAEAENWLRGVIAWVADHYDNKGPGLASVFSNPGDEIEYLLGGAFDHVELTRNPSSQIAGVVLDLAAILGFKDLYELAVNDFLAVEALPSIVESDDTNCQYVRAAEGGSYDPNMQYQEKWVPRDGWKLAPHHLRTPDTFYLNRIGKTWDHLAISAVLRDRHFLPSCRAFAPHH